LQSEWGAVKVVPRMKLDCGDHRFARWESPFRWCEAGDHIEIGGKWAVVRRVMGSRMTVEFLGLRPDPGKQDFPEYEAMRRFEALAKEKVEAGWDVHSTRNF
jgi:hypothetical protein